MQDRARHTINAKYPKWEYIFLSIDLICPVCMDLLFKFIVF